MKETYRFRVLLPLMAVMLMIAKRTEMDGRVEMILTRVCELYWPMFMDDGGSGLNRECWTWR